MCLATAWQQHTITTHEKSKESLASVITRKSVLSPTYCPRLHTIRGRKLGIAGRLVQSYHVCRTVCILGNHFHRHLIQFVCLFVRDSGKNYLTGRHQTLRDYKVGLWKCPPQVEIDRLAVLEELDSLTSGYGAVWFAVVQRLNLNSIIIIAATLCC